MEFYLLIAVLFITLVDVCIANLDRIPLVISFLRSLIATRRK
jgi:hypothetical protein